MENAVYSGTQSLFPYESDDLGGHVANPTPEQYIRWIEYGALSPIYRPHCTHNLERMPWVFGPEAEKCRPAVCEPALPAAAGFLRRRP